MARTTSPAAGWIAFQGHAERQPLRLTLSVTFGELPEGWSKSERAYRARTWVGLLGLLLIAPVVILFASALMRTAGITNAYDWLANSNAAILAATVSLFVGIPIALISSAWRITRLGMRRHAGRLEGLMAVEMAPLHLAVVGIALLCGGLFLGHLAADAYACMNGVRSAC